MNQIGTQFPAALPSGDWTTGAFTGRAPDNASQRGDRVSSRTLGSAAAPGWLGYGGGGAASDGAAGSGGLGGVLSAFYAGIQNLFGEIASALQQQPAPGTGAECAFTSATASSKGDPHESFNGTTTGGSTQGGKWDDHQSHADLLDSDSFSGGYRVSTTASAISNGVAYNASATVAMDGGADSVTMTKNGGVTVMSDGNAVSLASGQTVALGNGETVTAAADGSVRVAQSQAGSSVATTLRANGTGVDVTATAVDADLGGYLVTGHDGAAAGAPAPADPLPYRPIPLPQSMTATPAVDTYRLAGMPDELAIDSELV